MPPFTHREFLARIGLGGVSAHETPRAHLWERRLHGIMLVVALLAIPSFYLEELVESSDLRLLGWELDLLIMAVFTAELLWMVHVVERPALYLRRNWLNLLIIGGACASVVGFNSGWIPLARLLRLTYVALVVARLASSMRNLFSPSAIPNVLFLAALVLGVSGMVFYWVEPTVHTYGQGLWLAFVSAATVGYGDFVPTTDASRVFAVIVVIVGLAVLSLVTASIAAIFIGEDEKLLRREMHQDIRKLREEVAELKEDLRRLRSGEE